MFLISKRAALTRRGSPFACNGTWPSFSGLYQAEQEHCVKFAEHQLIDFCLGVLGGAAILFFHKHLLQVLHQRAAQAAVLRLYHRSHITCWAWLSVVTGVARYEVIKPHASFTPEGDMRAV
jgi:hypothetical protein